MKTAIVGLLATSLCLLTLVQSASATVPGPIPGSFCPFGYSPNAYTNLCVTPGGLASLPSATTECAPLIGNFTINGYCQFIPAVNPGFPTFILYVYVDALCNQGPILPCHCIDEVALEVSVIICSGLVTSP